MQTTISTTLAHHQREREELLESRCDLQVALHDELERYLLACRPLVQALEDVKARLAYLAWVDGFAAASDGAEHQ